MIIINKKLIALDLDGTTLDNNAQLSEITKTAIKKVVAAGHVVSIVTGRPNRLSENFYDELNLTSPMINFNGNLGTQPHDSWSLEYEYNVNKEIVAELLSKQNELGINLMAVEGRSLFMANRGASKDMGFFPTILKSNQILDAKNLKTNPISITVQMHPEAIGNLANYVNTHFKDDVTITPWGGNSPVMELAAKGIQKDTGVKRVADYYGIAQKDIMAFGDESNDYAMIKYAGLGVAMKNAISEIKSIANATTDFNNQENGVAHFLTNYFELN